MWMLAERYFMQTFKRILLLSFCLLCAEPLIAASGPPRITPSLPKRWVANGGTINLAFTVTDTLPLGFQWYRNGWPIQDATNAVYGITNALPGQTGLYTLTATNSEGFRASANVRLNVITFPTSVVGWGENLVGQISVPASLNDPSNGTNGVVAVAAGSGASYALKADGTVVAWGSPSALPVPTGLTNVVQITAAGVHCIALKSDGTVVVFGTSNQGQANVPAGLANIVAVSNEAGRVLALNADGQIFFWGGSPSYSPANDPDIIALASGDGFSLALKADQTVVGWGLLNYPGPAVPIGLSNVVALGTTAHAFHNLALKSDGTVFAWGQNFYGQTNVPSGLTDVIGVYAGERSSLALKTDGSLISWGDSFAVPNGVSNVVDAAVGIYHYLAVIQGEPPQSSGALSGEFVNGKFKLTLPSVINQSFVIHISADLTNWIPISSNYLRSGSALIDNETTNALRRFYRIVILP
jgi:hypothetical protein